MAARAWLFFAGALAVLGGCTGKPPPADAPGLPGDGRTAVAPPPAGPKAAGTRMFKVGKPYQVADKWYYPEADLAYEERGIASWYGPNFHGKRTANGEVFDMTKISAAHRTLPMPSVVRVTNLENGRSLIVRINDRGPFARGRIIDLSRRAAELLGFTANGTAMVHVRLLAEESRRAAMEAGATEADMDLFGPPPPEAAPSVAVTVEPLSSGEAREEPRAGTPRPSQMTAVAGEAAGDSRKPSSAPSPPRRYTDTASLNWGFAPSQDTNGKNGGAGAAASAVQEPASAAGSRPQSPGTGGQEPSVERLPVREQPKIFIQAGAFRQFVNANRLRARLTTLGHPVDVSQVYVTNQPFFRVRLGPLGSVEDADLALERVVLLGYPEARIVVD